MKKVLSLVAFVLSLPTLANDIYKEAIHSDKRPAEDRKADTRRKPQSVLKFFNIQPGQKVLDLFSGGGYYTEIVSHIVGKNGQVDAHNNDAYIKFIGKEKLLKRYQNDRLQNVKQLHQEANDLSLCKGCYDRVLMVLTFHDLFYVDDAQGWPEINANLLMEKIRLSLKDNGIVGIVDHNAEEGTGTGAAQTLHRIDPQIIKNKMEHWGFTLLEQADILANDKDNLSLPMWDEKVRGKTDRTVMSYAPRL